MTKEQYNEWRNHPATLFFRQFLKDRRTALMHKATETFLNDHKAFEEFSMEARGRILELFDVEDVGYEIIETFYQERDDAGKDSSDDSR